MPLLDDDPGYGRRTSAPPQLSLPPYYVAAPGRPSLPPPDRAQPPWAVEDRTLYVRALQNILTQASVQERIKAQPWYQAAERGQAFAELNRLRLAADRMGIQPYTSPYMLSQNKPVTPEQEWETRIFGRPLQPAEEAALGLREQRDPFAETASLAYRGLRTEIPGAVRVREAAGAAARAAASIPAPWDLMPGVDTRDTRGRIAGAVTEASIPVEVWDTALTLMPAAKAKSIPQLISALTLGDADALYALKSAGRKLGESPKVERLLGKLASEAGGPGTAPESLIRAAADAGEEAVRLPAPSPPLLSAPRVKAPRYLDPPEVARLSQRFPTVAPRMRAMVAFAEAKSQTRGGVTRGVGNAIAEKVDQFITRNEDSLSQGATKFLNWFSNESTRFRSPINEAVTEYRRALKAGDVWAAETGTEMGRAARHAFKGNPNDVFRGTDGQPILWMLDDGTQIRLLNRDVMENAHVPEIAARMTPEQLAVARANGAMMEKLRAQARASGARIGKTPGIGGEEVSSYVHRTAIEVRGRRVMEYGDPARPGGKLLSEQERKYVTAAEGVRNGVRYANNWSEEYVSHLRALRKHEANAALKEWTDSLSETLSERIARLDPRAATARETAHQLYKTATERYNRVKSVITKRVRRDAERRINEARRAVSIAQRQLDRHTTGQVLEDVRLRMPDAMAIGKAREDLAAAIKAGDGRAIRAAQRKLDGLTTQQALQTRVLPRDRLIENVGRAREQLAQAVRDLREGADASIDALYRRLDDADRVSLLEAQAMREEAKAAIQQARKTYYAARAKAREGLGYDIFEAPGGLPLTQGRYFQPGDAAVIRELAEEIRNRNAPVHPLVAALRLVTTPLNFVTLTADNSFFGVQGWLTLSTAPHRWASMVVESPFVAAMPRFRQRWLQTHDEAVRWVMKYAPEAFDNNPDFAVRGSLTSEVTANIPGVNYFNQLFKDARTMSAVHLYETLGHMAENEQEAYDLGSHIVKMTGLSRTTGGEKDILLAAGFLRSRIGLALDAASNSGVQGKAARQAFGRLIGGAALLTLSYQYFVKGERDPRKLMDAVTPGKQGSFEIEGVNLLGSFSAELNTVGRIALDPSSAREQLAFFARGKLSIFLGNLYSGIANEDILGRPTSFREQFLSARGYVPLSFQQMREWNMRGAPKEIAIPAAIFGFKYNPPTAYGTLANALTVRGIEPDVFFSEPGTRRAAMEAHPELRKLYQNWEQSRRLGTTGQRAAQAIVDASRKHIESKIGEILAREARPSDLREYTQTEALERRTLREALLPERGPDDQRLDPLYALAEQATNPDTGEVNFELLLQLQENYLQAHEDLRTAWEAQQFVPYTDHPLEAMLKDGQRMVATATIRYGESEVTWFGLEEAIWKDLREGNPGLEAYPDYRDYLRERELESLKYGMDEAKLAGQDPYIKSMVKAKTLWRRAMLSQYPELGANLRVWYGVDLPDSDLPAGVRRLIAEETTRIMDAIYGSR